MCSGHIKHLLTKLRNNMVEENAFEVICTLHIVSLSLTAMIILLSICRGSNDLVTNITISRQILGLVCRENCCYKAVLVAAF